MIIKDNIHFTGKHMNSFNATFNFVWSARESGKTTTWVNNAFKRWKNEQATTIVLRYLIADITDTYISDLETSINDFLSDDKQIKFFYKKGSIKDGVVDVFIRNDKSNIPLFRFIAVSNPISRIKSMKLQNCCQIIFDEAILNVRAGEKYPPSLVIRFKEIYNTYLRCCKTGKKFKVFCFGNPYSKYHPLLSEWNVPFGILKEGVYYYNKKYDVYCEAYKLKEELKKLILERNPLYKFDNSYTDYAFNGESINDTNFIIVDKQPQNYVLTYLFRIQNKYLKIFKANIKNESQWSTGKFWIKCDESYNGSKMVISVDLDNLINGTELLTGEMKLMFWRLKNSIATRNVSFQSIESGYLIEALYSFI